MSRPPRNALVFALALATLVCAAPLGAGGLSAEEQAAQARAQRARAPATAPALVVREAGLRCSPHVLRPGDTLEIVLPAGHGGDMAIVNPQRQHLFIAFASDRGTPTLQPIIPAEQFQAMSQLTLDVARARGIQWRAGADQHRPVPVFVRPGVYTILVSASLETEDPVLDGWCRIEFRPRGR